MSNLFEKYLGRVYIECGDGWRNIINQALERIDKLFASQNRKSIPIEFTQVKEKFAGIRMYYHVIDDEELSEYEYNELNAIICDVERESFTRCEYCGEPGARVKKVSGWLKTMCAACHNNELSAK